jgi:hypothetical protein
LREYLGHPSIDGAISRQALRTRIKQLINDNHDSESVP